MPLRILVSGANGFVGSAICRVLSERGHTVVPLVRRGAELDLLPAGLEPAHGEFHDAASIRGVLRETRPDVVVHAAAVVSMGKPDLDLSMRINVEGTRTFAAEASAAGVARWIQISSMSAHAANRSVYGGTKYLADEEVRRGAPSWTILRPSIIYGPAPRGIFHKLTRLLAKLPAVPLVGSGAEDMRPVHVDDVATAVAEAIDRPESIGREYMLGCLEPMSCRDFFRETARAVRGREPALIPVPLWMCRIIAAVGEALLPAPPMTLDNVEGVTRAQPVDPAPAVRDLGFAPRRYAEGLAACLGRTNAA